MPYNPARHHRRSIRLQGYDYTQSGMYFVTICAYQKQCLFGEIINGQMRLNQYGQIVTQTYQWLSQRYPYICLDEWIVMPNHFHGVMLITDNPCRGGSRTAPTTTEPTTTEPTTTNPIITNPITTEPTTTEPTTTNPIITEPTSSNDVSKPKPLGRLIGAFKTVSTKQINILRNTPGTPVWQRNYYEHIIRSQDALDYIREYIINNPNSWETDRLNPLTH
ncbi:transposase [Pleurocapsales cyanobacterium LEGE 06147]|nr:transposase [Pleurocapsales cyanobacterium LEGE 06147]